MCGIAGYLATGNAAAEEVASRCASMLARIVHRGPDDSGIWTSSQPVVALGHRRLAILEMSAAGHQPMTSADGRFVVVFNGEIYNHLALRARLEDEGVAVRWRGHSDTETLLECAARWGIEPTLQSCVGMFALALWDLRDGELILARDRMGEKPVYYGWQRDAFLFGSELKALRAHPAFEGRIDWGAAAAFLRRNFVPAPHCIYEGIHKLLPGTLLRLTRQHVASREMPVPRPYWSLSDAAMAGAERPFEGSFDDAVDHLEVLLRESVALQSVADVPVGAFLSGGVDSSAVVALMRAAPGADVRTFSIGMPEAGMDESRHAQAVAQHLGTRHVQHVVQPAEALEIIPRLPQIWDEPLGDSSQVPTYIVSRIARRDVTVALSGDGGDELFLGYAQYGLYQRLWRLRRLGHLPWRGLLGPLSIAARAAPPLQDALRRAEAVVKAWRQTDVAALDRFWSDRYRSGPVPLARQGGAAARSFPLLPDVASTAALSDAGTYLPDDILVKVDRASMAHSLETRAPLLDHRVVEFALSLPPEYKMTGGEQKRVLKEVLYRHVPRALVDRPKMGFSIPLAHWLRHELRDWVEALVADIPASGSPFDRGAVERLWREHVEGRRDHTERLWGVISLLQFARAAAAGAQA
jgi:asparagine synthase (glutamine-hydrolysing)